MTEPTKETEVWSVSEWLYYYREQFFLLSEQKRFLFFYRTQQIETPAFHQIRARYPELAVLSGEEHNG